MLDQLGLQMLSIRGCHGAVPICGSADCQQARQAARASSSVGARPWWARRGPAAISVLELDMLGEGGLSEEEFDPAADSALISRAA